MLVCPLIQWKALFPLNEWTAFQSYIEDLINEDLCKYEGGRQLTLTASGKLLADRIAIHLMEAAENVEAKSPLTVR